MVTSALCKESRFRQLMPAGFKHGLMALGVAVMVGGAPGLSSANDLSRSQEETVEGEVTVIHIDEMNPEESRMAYFLEKRGSTEIVEMLFDGQPPKQFRQHLQTGKKIRMKGRRTAHRENPWDQNEAWHQNEPQPQEALVDDAAAWDAASSQTMEALYDDAAAWNAAGSQTMEYMVDDMVALDDDSFPSMEALLNDEGAWEGASAASIANARTTQATIGARKAITFVINMEGVNYAAHRASPYTQAHVDQAGRAMHDHVRYSANSVYKEGSFDQVTFPGSAATNVFLISIPYDPARRCNFNRIAAQADAASPVSLKGYLHKVYVVPPRAISGCKWIGLGIVGRHGSTRVTRSWISSYMGTMVFAHELGHNIGWHHAAIDPDNDGKFEGVFEEYGDWSDVMGNRCCSTFNSVHRDQAGWFDRKDLQDKVVDVTKSGKHTIAPLGMDPGASNDPQILRITPATGRPYYLSYRQQKNFDARMPASYAKGVNIHRGKKSGIWSYFIKVLGNSEKFHDAANELTLTQVEKNANFVTVDIDLGGGKCVVGKTQASLHPRTLEVKDLTQSPSYALKVTNTDSVECGKTTYQVSLTATDKQGKVVPAITGIVTKPVLTVGPQSQGQTAVTLKFGDVANGLYTLTTKVSDQKGKEPKHAAQLTGSLKVNAPVCHTRTPRLTLTPNKQFIQTVAAVQPYTLSVTNQDSSACSSSRFNLAVGKIVDRTGNVASGIAGVIQDAVLAVKPGAKKTTTLNLTLSQVSNGTYSIPVRVSDVKPTVQNHVETVRGTLQIQLKKDDSALLPPSNLVAVMNPKGTKLTVKWDPAEGAASYIVYRNGKKLGNTKDQRWWHRRPNRWKDGAFSRTALNTYEVYAVDREGKRSATAARTTFLFNAPALKPPSNLLAVMNPKRTKLTVKWDPAEGAASYIVYRNGKKLGNTKDQRWWHRKPNRWKDGAFSRTALNTYEVYAVDREGKRSATAARTTFLFTAPAPKAPLKLTAKLEGNRLDRERVVLRWIPDDQSSPVAAYHVYRNGVKRATTRNLRFVDRSFARTGDNTYEVYAVGPNRKLSPAAREVFRKKWNHVR